MKPLRLRLQAFGPYPRESVVDFRPLREGGLFLIHGPTGAGKTSILDGICFSLFGRASGAERSPDALRSDRAPGDLATEARLEFELGRDVYRVTRQPKQEIAKKRGDGTKTSRPEGVLEKLSLGDDLDTGTWDLVASGDKKTDDAVVSLLGMNEEQFRQVVVLPQGQFRKFLSAGSDEREDLLERLFRTHRYRELGETMEESSRVLAREISEKRTKATALLTSLDVASGEDLSKMIDEARKRIAELETGEGELERRHAEASARASAAREVMKLRHEIEAAKETRERAEAELASARDLRDTLLARAPEAKAWEREIDEVRFLYPKASRLIKIRAELRMTTSELEKFERTFAESSKKLQEVRARLPFIEEKSESLQAKIRTATEQSDEHASVVREIETARELFKRVSEFLRLKTRANETKALATRAETEWGEANRATSRLKLAFHVAQAARLAAELEDGEPCPVCGSADHPAPATLSAQAPTPEEIEKSETELLKLGEAKAKTLAQVEALASEISRLETELARELSGTNDGWETLVRERGASLKTRLDVLEIVRTEAKSAHAALSQLKLERERAEKEVRDLEAKLAQETKTRDERTAKRRDLLTQVELLEADLPEEKRDLDKLEARGVQLGRLLDEFRESEKLAQAKAERAASEGAAAVERVKTLEERRAEREAKLENSTALTETDVAVLEARFTEIDKVRTESRAERLSLAGRIRQLESARERNLESTNEIAKLEERYKIVGRLAEISAGRPPNELRINFQRYVLASRLDDVLEQASRRLHSMSNGRFTLKRSRRADDKRRSAGLDLEVEDAFTGTTRGTASLSGGEGFLASLALALGLADVVQMHLGGVRLEAVFVDEGFGTLDPEALELAMRVLTDLQAGGRIVGIISHVPELRDQIARRLAVRKTVDGSEIAWETGSI